MERVFELVYLDLIYPEDVPYEGKAYSLIFIDDFSQYTWKFLLKCQSDAVPTFHAWFAYVEHQSDHKHLKFNTKMVISIHQATMNQYLQYLGIDHFLTAP
jgi:hypothetical protein